jgi:hypothetical protein
MRHGHRNHILNPKAMTLHTCNRSKGLSEYGGVDTKVARITHFGLSANMPHAVRRTLAQGAPSTDRSEFILTTKTAI